MTRNWFEVVPSKYTFRSGIKLEFDGLVFEGRFVWRSWELKDGEIPGFICSDVTVIATAVPEEINLYREFPRSLDSCSRIIMMWDQFLSRKGRVPMQFLCFCLEGVCTRVDLHRVWDVPRIMLDKRGIQQWCPGFAECSDPSLPAAVRVRCLGFSQGKSSTFQMKSNGIGQGGRIQWLTVKWWNDISRSLDICVIFLHDIHLWSLLYTALKSTYPPLPFHSCTELEGLLGLRPQAVGSHSN